MTEDNIKDMLGKIFGDAEVHEIHHVGTDRPEHLLKLLGQLSAPNISKLEIEHGILDALIELQFKFSDDPEILAKAAAARKISRNNKDDYTPAIHQQLVAHCVELVPNLFMRSMLSGDSWDECPDIEDPNVDLADRHHETLAAHRIGLLLSLMKALEIVGTMLMPDEALPAMYAWFGAEMQKRNPELTERIFERGQYFVRPDPEWEGLIGFNFLANPILIAIMDSLIGEFMTDK